MNNVPYIEIRKTSKLFFGQYDYWSFLPSYRFKREHFFIMIRKNKRMFTFHLIIMVTLFDEMFLMCFFSFILFHFVPFCFIHIKMSKNVQKFYRHTFFHHFLKMRALCSQVTLQKKFFRPSFQNPKMDIYKCPKSKNLFPIWKKVVTKKIRRKIQ